MIRRIRSALSRWIIKPEKVYLIIALVGVIGFALITPPFQGPDEEAHYVRTQYIAHGYLIPLDVNGTSAALPDSIMVVAKKTFYRDDLRGKTADKYEIDRTKDALKEPLDNGKTYQPVMVSYSPLPYLPAAIGVFFANLLNANPLVSLYIARLLLAITSVVITFYAIKLIPHKKYLLVAIGLTPMLLFQQAVVTADGVSYALLVLFIAYILYLRQAGTLVRNQWFILSIMSVGIVLAKPLVFLFLPCILLLARKPDIKKVIAIFALCAVVLAGWLMMTNPKVDVTTVSSLPNGANSHQQLDMLLSHPTRIFRVGWNTYMTSYGDDQERGVIGIFGAADVYYPLWMAAGYIIVLGVLCATDIEDKKIKATPGIWKLLVAVLCVGYFIATNLALYLGYTPVNFDIVYGVQGRYFLPILIVALIALGSRGVRIRSSDATQLRQWVVIWMAILVFLALFITYQRYYLYTP